MSEEYMVVTPYGQRLLELQAQRKTFEEAKKICDKEFKVKGR